MANILQSLNKTIIAGIILAIIVFIIMSASNNGFAYDRNFWSTIFRYLHVLSGFILICLLWYFNFVQIPNMPKIPDEQKPAIGKVIAPAALWWFRWSAMSTIIFGVLLAHPQGYLLEAILSLKATLLFELSIIHA